MGKTIQTIILIVSTKREPDEGPTIIVTKKSLVSNWLKELQMAVSHDAPLKVLVPDSEVKSYCQNDVVVHIWQITLQTEATELYANDVVLTHYEFIVQQYFALRDFEQSFRDFQRDPRK